MISIRVARNRFFEPTASGLLRCPRQLLMMARHTSVFVLDRPHKAHSTQVPGKTFQNTSEREITSYLFLVYKFTACTERTSTRAASRDW